MLRGLSPQVDFNANLRMCIFTVFYAFCTFANNRIPPHVGRDTGAMALQSGHLTTSKSSRLARPLFLEAIRGLHTSYLQLTGPALCTLIAARNGPNLSVLGPVRTRRVYRVRIWNSYPILEFEYESAGESVGWPHSLHGRPEIVRPLRHFRGRPFIP